MTVHVVRKKGREYIVVDTRPSKHIRQAQRRGEKRMQEIHSHFRNRKAEN